MEYNLLKFLQLVFLPPASLLLIAFFGCLLIRFKPIWGVRMVVLSCSMLYMCSLPVIVTFIAGLIEAPPLQVDALAKIDADAIVILAAGRIRNSPEYGDDVVGSQGAQRVRYAAFLHKKTRLPIIVSGGTLQQTQPNSESFLIKKMLSNDYGISVAAIEERSKTTYENALYTTEILQSMGFKHILLVTHALHIPRAKRAFEKFSIRVSAAPTVFYARQQRDLLDQILPDTSALQLSSHLFHEMLGNVWYQLRY